MAGNYIVEKNGRKYVYRSTSVYDPETRSKRTVSEYIGKIDPVTGELIEKRTKSRSMPLPSKYPIIKDFGSCYVLLSVAESCGLRSDLRAAFGSDGDCILALAMSLVLAGGPGYSLDAELESNMSRELLNLNATYTMEALTKVANTLARDKVRMSRFFRQRVERSPRVALSTRTVRMYAGEDEAVGYDGPRYVLATGVDGTPVYMEVARGDSLDDREVMMATNRIARMDASETIATLDISWGLTGMRRLMDEKVQFLAVVEEDAPMVRRLTSSISREDRGLQTRHSGEEFTVREARLVVVPESNLDTSARRWVIHSEDGLALIDENCVDGDSRTSYITAWVTRNDSGFEDGKELVHAALTRMATELEEMGEAEATAHLEEVAGGFSRYLDFKSEGGRFRVRVRRKGLTAALNRRASIVILANRMNDWEGAMEYRRCMDAPQRLEGIMRSRLTADLDSGNGMALMAWMLVRFSALVMWDVLERRLSESEDGTPVQVALQYLDSIKSEFADSSWRVSMIYPECFRLLDSLGIPAPKANVNIFGSGYYGFSTTDALPDDSRDRDIA